MIALSTRCHPWLLHHASNTSPWKVFRLAPFSVAIYPFLAPISWLVTPTELALPPVIAGISMATGKNEVRFFSLLYTHDASLDGGIKQAIDGYDPNAEGLVRLEVYRLMAPKRR
ncbi:hypothetical protein AS026_28435 [Rhizobium altiplani]|uniref:Uncharacterized protein n=1 Tax=Rhizobium altiplani TaxID=1864509 RepID=A0A109K350_9HYPH|nr:hypothetical protein [Rhizobium altiplani]KWV59579.1 hypothetical protein AS026_28435 [Rhizobium altiplani]